MRREFHGNDHLDVARDQHNLGVIYSHLGATESASASLEEALEIRIELLGDGHSKVEETRGVLASSREQFFRKETRS